LENRAERGELDKRGGELRYAVEAILLRFINRKSYIGREWGC
jgi:hypothetical protein